MNRCELCGYQGHVARSLLMNDKVVCRNCYENHSGAPTVPPLLRVTPTRTSEPRPIWRVWFDLIARRQLPLVPNLLGGKNTAAGSECPLCGAGMRVTWTERTITFLCLADVPCDEVLIARDLRQHGAAHLQPEAPAPPPPIDRYLNALRSLGLPVLVGGEGCATSRCPQCRSPLRITWDASGVSLDCLGDPACPESVIAHYLGADAA